VKDIHHAPSIFFYLKEVTRSSYKSANDLVSDFVNVGILKEMTGQNRNRIFGFDQYLKMF
jgi:hypothetical protein